MERTIISFDYAIKNVLRDKANFDILSGFLTELLEKPVTVQEIVDSESNTDTLEGKVNRLDLKAKIDDDELAVFEIQFFDQIDFFGKILFNVSKAVVEQISSGESYDIKKVYSINIAYFGIGAKKEYMFVANLNEFKGMHSNEVIPFSQNLDPRGAPKHIHPEYFLIVPKKFNEKIKDKFGNVVSDVFTEKTAKKFDEWVYVLKNSVVKSEFTAAGIQEAGEKLNVLKMTPQQRAAYEADKQAMMTQKSQLYTAELKGRIEGKAEGEIISLQKSVIRGYNKGHSIETIADLTDLSKEQVLILLKENGLNIIS